ncbi:pilin [Variovorax sp. PAMC26660]|uniref:pilin n=1 Tax=Variovorax sp. PAMC26660 TaxID=2762322 RepID=UPI00164E311B|nr:pilin [Variovorax sp. PAMC26660]QNK70161.1 pilin [Variovorax sp. PAMC26660]
MNRRSIARNVQKGFTLIELMIVVAIIGILAAIAIPQYQTYVAKSQISRVIGETGSQKTAVEDCVINGKLTASATSCAGTATGSNLVVSAGTNTVNGGLAPAGMGAPILSFGGLTDGSATLTSTFGNNAASVIAGKKIVWSRDASGTWSCLSDVPKKYEQVACPTSSAT